MLDPWFESVPAAVMAFYPGMRGGLATTRVLFGDVNPSGKIPFVIPCKERDLPHVDWLADEQEYGYYHGYAKLDKEGIRPRLPYGYGLSYTTFELGKVKLKGIQDGIAVFEAEVKNTGDRAGGEVVQLYAGWNGSRVDRPEKRLQDFVKVYLDAGKSRTVELGVRKATSLTLMRHRIPLLKRRSNILPISGTAPRKKTWSRYTSGTDTLEEKNEYETKPNLLQEFFSFLFSYWERRWSCFYPSSP